MRAVRQLQGLDKENYHESQELEKYDCQLF
jgi:hypothetical protein